MAGAIAIKGRTLVEKIAAKASGRADARAGDLVTADVDLCFAHDSSGPRRWAPMLADLGRGLWDPSKIVITSDHYVPAVDAESAAILSLITTGFCLLWPLAALAQDLAAAGGFSGARDSCWHRGCPRR